MPNIVKITTIINPLNLLAPHTCRGCGRTGSPLCDCCKNYILVQHYNFCPICKNKSKDGKCSNHLNLPPIYTLGHRHGLIDQLIHDLKYSSVRSIARPLAELANQILPIIATPVIIVPLPTIPRHIRERGLDHTKLIAKHIVRQHNSWQVQPILSRNKNTVQVGSNRKTRLEQAELAYQLNPKYSVNPHNTYILLDDVWTTGASMKAAIKKLRQAGAKNILVVVLTISEIN